MGGGRRQLLVQFQPPEAIQLVNREQILDDIRQSEILFAQSEREFDPGSEFVPNGGSL